MNQPFDPDSLGLIPRPFELRITGGIPYTVDDDVAVHLLGDPAAVGLDEESPLWRRKEAYRLTIAGGKAEISALAEAGIRHGRRALTQIIGAGPVPDLVIVDHPEFEWRGLNVDIVRHFFTLEDLTVVLDIMGDLRLNRLHLHLSDDQGWRIEIPSLPELVQLSSGTSVGAGEGGHLSLEDMERLIGEAAERGIVVVPEVDVPGHTTAALHALPGLNPDGRTPPVYEGIEVGISTLSTRAPDTARFLDAVADTLAPLGSDGVHVGGDECLLTPPEEFAELVSMAVRRIHDRGRRVIAWQEGAAQLRSGDLLQLWDERQDMSDVAAATRRGVRVIASPASRVYLDMKYDDSERLGLTWAGCTSLRESFEWDPRTLLVELGGGDAEAAEPDPQAIAGVEACVFTETIETVDDLVYMLLPRLAAAAEISWAGGGTGWWESFARRIAVHAAAWQRNGYVWHRSPEVEWDLHPRRH
ncbi:family 20 glycosylhydrolase [Actinomycetaceae bacterium L2_0104]